MMDLRERKHGVKTRRIASVVIGAALACAACGPTSESSPDQGTVSYAIYDAACETASGEYVLTGAQWDAIDNQPMIQCLLDNPDIRVIRLAKPTPTEDTWITSRLIVPATRHDLELFFEPGVRLLARQGAYSGLQQHSSIINIHGAPNPLSPDGVDRPNNITIRSSSYNNKGRIEYPPNLDGQTCLPGEHRHAISIQNADNVLVDMIRIDRTYGDGIFIGDSNDNVPRPWRHSRWVTIKNTEIDRAARNGISINAGKQISLLNCTITNVYDQSLQDGCTAVSGPWSGIDIEPDQSEHPLSNINILHSDISNTAGNGILLELANAAADQDSNWVDVTVTRPRISGSGASAIRISNAYEHLSGELTFEEAELVNTQLSAIYLQDKTKGGPSVSFVDSRIANANLSSSSDVQNAAPLVFYKADPSVYFRQDAPDGDVSLANLTVTNNPGTRPLVKVQGRPQYPVDGISGSIELQSGCSTIETTNASNIAISVF